jgi:hypothetical protein
MGFGRTYVARDRWRVNAAAGTGNYNFQFFVNFPIDGWIPYSSEIGFGFIHLQRKLYRKLYAGISYIYLDFETSLEALPDTSYQQTLNGLGADLSLDRRFAGVGLGELSFNQQFIVGQGERYSWLYTG